MKNKIILGLIVSMLSVATAGCGLLENGNTGKTVAETENKNEQEVSSQEISTDNEEKSDTDKDNNDSTANDDKVTDEFSDKVIFDEMFDDTIAYVGDDYNSTNKYTLKDKLGLSENEYFSIQCTEGSKIYYSLDKDNKTYFYRYDLNNDTKDEVCSVDSYLVYADIYEDKIYVGVSEDDSYIERVFDKETLDEMDNTESIYDSVKDYSVDLPINVWNKDCIAKTLENTNGYLVLDKFEDGPKYYLYNNGEISPLEFDVELPSVISYDEDSIAYTASAEDSSGHSLWIYNYLTGENNKITDKCPYQAVWDNGYLYWLEEDDTEYGRSIYNCKAYDKKTKNITDVYSYQKNPGMNELIGPSDFAVYDGDVYYISDEDNIYDWHVAKKNGDGYEVSKLEVNTKKPDLFDLGTVEYIQSVENCEKCGNTSSKFYGEYFVLDDMYDNAASINDVMKGYIENASESLSSNPLDCDLHSEAIGIVTEDIKLDRVQLIGSNYLSVDYSGYWYGGGAHGLPTINNFLFNLSSGEEMNFSDVYSGSTDELAELLADKAVEIMDSYKYGTPFYSDDPEEVRSSVIESVKMESYEVLYGEETVTFSFVPYDLGPYASGFIELELTYDELGIDEFSLS